MLSQATGSGLVRWSEWGRRPPDFSSSSGDITTTISSRGSYRIGQSWSPALGLHHDGHSGLGSCCSCLHQQTFSLCLASNTLGVHLLDSLHSPLQLPLWGGCLLKATSGLSLAQPLLPWSMSMMGWWIMYCHFGLPWDRGILWQCRLPETLQRR